MMKNIKKLEFNIIIVAIIATITTMMIDNSFTNNSREVYAQIYPGNNQQKYGDSPGTVGTGFVGGSQSITVQGSNNQLSGEANTMTSNAQGGDDSLTATGSNNF